MYLFVFILFVLAFKKFVKRSLTTLKYDVENINRRIDGIETSLETILNKIVSQPINSYLNTGGNDEEIIYIENDSDLEVMEEKLANDPLYRSTVVCIFIN